MTSVAAHPGYASTHLQAAGPELAGNKLMVRLTDLANKVTAQPAEMGALPQLYAATAPGVTGGSYYGPDGLFEQRGHPEQVQASKAANRLDEARNLWRVSEDLTGVTYDWPTPS